MGDNDQSRRSIDANASVAPDGPFKIQAQFGIIGTPDADGSVEIGYAKVMLPFGEVPTRESISERAVYALAHLPEGFRFMTRQEFADHLLSDDAPDCDTANGTLTFKLDVFG